MKKYFFLFSLMICTLQLVAATPQDTPNKARQEFEKIYNMVFGPQGMNVSIRGTMV